MFPLKLEFDKSLKRLLNWFFSSTAALLQKLAKENDDAAIVLRKAEEIEHTQSLTNSNRCVDMINSNKAL